MTVRTWTTATGNGADLELEPVEAGTLLTVDLTFKSGTAPGNNPTTGRAVHLVYLPDPSPDFAGDPVRPYQDVAGDAADAIDAGRGREFWLDLSTIWCPYRGQVRVRAGAIGTTWSVAQTRTRCRRKPRDLVHRFSYYEVNGSTIIIPRGAMSYQLNATTTSHTLSRDGGSAVIAGAQGTSGTVGPWTQMVIGGDTTVNSAVFVVCIGPDEVDLDAWRLMDSPWRQQAFPVQPEAVGLVPHTLDYDPTLGLGRGEVWP